MKTQERKPRFKRDPSVALRLTDRDLEIIRLVYKHRFLSSDQLSSLVDGSRQKLLRRLNLLFHGGFLDRPRAQLGRIGTNHPMVYGLANEGAQLLSEKLGIPLASVDWTTKHREAKGMFLEHTLMVAEALVSMKLACQKRPGIEFVDPEEIQNRRTTDPSLPGNPLSWSVEAKGGRFGLAKARGFSIGPDSAFGLRVSEEPQRNRMAFFFLEADRSTEPIQRADLFRNSIFKKMVGYLNSWDQGLFAENFGFKKARILFITLSAKRVESMVRLNKKLDPSGQGYRLFLFTEEKAIDRKDPGKLLDKVWIDGTGAKVSLLD